VSENFAQDLGTIEKAVLFATQGPTSGRALGGVVAKAGWKNKSSWYIVATEDRAISPDLQKTMAKKIGAKTTAAASSHLVML